uniref:Uncharacterized protein n=1 Tax=Octopus bimaculoides TaxID=37653 RepID=A0A0L8HLI2_OCTBM
MYALLPNNICFCSIWSVFLILSAILITDNSISVNGLEQSKKIFRRQVTEKITPTTTTLKTSSSTLSPPASSSCSPSSNSANSSSSCNNGTVNNSHTSSFHHIVDRFQKNKGMLLRTLYVLIAITSIVVIYFAVKSLR